jgi:RNA polymerase sigma-70 factor (ECF subfamily)
VASLPRWAERHAARLSFVERIEPTTQVLEDADSGRLVVRFQQGDADVFGKLYLRYFDRVYSYVRVALRNAHDAEDITQQVFMSALERLDRYELRAGQPFRGWLFVIARNLSITHMRRSGSVDFREPDEIDRRRERSEPDDRALPALGWLSDPDLVLLIERLPIAQRQVLFLRFELDLSYAEIAGILERSEDDVRALQSRGVRFLRARLSSLGRDSRWHARRIGMRSKLRPATVLAARRWRLYYSQ